MAAEDPPDDEDSAGRAEQGRGSRATEAGAARGDVPRAA
jgi:hypothetical protein